MTTKSQVKLAQRHLTEGGFEPGPIDGDHGPRTEAAVDRALTARTSQLPTDWKSWSKKRKIIAYIQLLCVDAGIDTGLIDGFWGPQTEFAYESLVYLELHGQLPPPWRDQEPSTANPNNWPIEREASLRAFYGDVGANQTRIALPYTHKIAWDLSKRINSFVCHEKVHDSLHRVLTRVVDHYGHDRISELRLDHWGGCYNKRKKRGGTSWSTHAWAIAVDYDPARNRLAWGRDQAAFAKPAYITWWQIWEEEGWVSLGRTRNFDWMHVQAARLP